MINPTGREIKPKATVSIHWSALKGEVLVNSPPKVTIRY
jgi:hypothetical protein